MPPHPTLEQLRQRIDRVDARILRLLNRRAGLAMRVGRLKQRDGLRLFDPKREAAILRHLIQTNIGPLSAAAVRAIYREILRQVRRVERSA